MPTQFCTGLVATSWMAKPGSTVVAACVSSTPHGCPALYATPAAHSHRISAQSPPSVRAVRYISLFYGPNSAQVKSFAASAGQSQFCTPQNPSSTYSSRTIQVDMIVTLKSDEEQIRWPPIHAACMKIADLSRMIQVDATLNSDIVSAGRSYMELK
ncbi:hypothetical protein C8R44DRAFT_748059 [Mycena epipterygia]|nr:hypothetical protein C8R44DRAFT_748059 [Mycena epipterygia]